MGIFTTLMALSLIDTARTGIVFAMSKKMEAKDHVYKVGDYTVVSNDHDMTLTNIIAETRLVNKESNVATVATDGIFELMPEDVKKCILAHELGHMVLDHGEITFDEAAMYTLKRFIGMCPEQEKVADSMGTKLYGKKAMFKALAFQFIFSPGPELIQRMYAVVKGGE